jgi:integrase
MGKRRGNSEGTIYQRSDGRWCGQLTVGADRETVYGKTRKEVANKMLARREELRIGTPVLSKPDERLTVGELAERWLAAARPSLAGSAVRIYERQVGHLKKRIGTLPAAKLTALEVGTFLQNLQSAGLASSYQREIALRLRQVLEYGRKTAAVASNVARTVPLPRARRPEFRPMRPHEVRSFLDAARQHCLYALFLTALDTGARVGELIVLERDDWDSVGRALRFVKTLDTAVRKSGYLKPKDSKTRSSRRTLRVNEDTAAVIEEHLKRTEARKSRLLFPTRSGRYHWPSHVRVFFKNLLSAAGLDPNVFRFHDLRHTCATLLLLAGVDARTVAARLGHSSPLITLRTYAHVLPEGEDRAVKAIGSFLRAGG